MSKKVKILWLSRHEMSADQLADLLRTIALNADQVSIEPRNLTWAASADVEADRIANLTIWAELVEATEGGGAITGVFPQVALESMPRGVDKTVMTPVSRQAPELRVGNGPIPFQHLRWSYVK